MDSKFINVKYLAVLLLGIVFLLLVSFDAFSQSEIDLGSFGDTTSMSTSADIMKQVVSYEPYESTCSREVYDGTRTVCRDGRTERRCRKVSGVGEECWDETENVCSEESVYRTESYSCTEYARVVNDVYDYTVNAQVDIVKTLRAKNFDLNSCRFGIDLKASSESFYARCLNSIIKVNVVSRNEVMNGRNKERTLKLDLDFFDISGLDALKQGLTGLAFKNGMATFVTGNLDEAGNFKLNLKLTRNRFLLKDKVLVNKALNPGDYTVERLADGRSRVTIKVSKFAGEFDSTKKHTLKIDLQTVKAVETAGSINIPKLENALTQSIVIND